MLLDPHTRTAPAQLRLPPRFGSRRSLLTRHIAEARRGCVLRLSAQRAVRRSSTATAALARSASSALARHRSRTAMLTATLASAPRSATPCSRRSTATSATARRASFATRTRVAPRSTGRISRSRPANSGATPSLR
eukprot:5247369-Prymnesium_polylepis.1